MYIRKRAAETQDMQPRREYAGVYVTTIAQQSGRSRYSRDREEERGIKAGRVIGKRGGRRRSKESFRAGDLGFRVRGRSRAKKGEERDRARDEQEAGSGKRQGRSRRQG